MGSEFIHINPTYFNITVLCLLIFGGLTRYASKKKVVNKAIDFTYLGFVFCFLSGWLASMISPDSNYLRILVFLELFILNVAVSCFASSATQLLANSKSEAKMFAYVLGAGALVSSFFVYLYPDGLMVDKLRYLYPFVGFCYISVAFCSKVTARGFTYFMAALVLSLLSLKFLLAAFAVSILNVWWLNSAVYLTMAVIFVMMRSEELLKSMSDTKDALNKSVSKFQEIIEYSPFPITISRLSDDKIIVANENALKLFDIYKDDFDRYKLKDFFADSSGRKELTERMENEGSLKDFEFLANTKSAFSPFWLLSSVSVIDYDMAPSLYIAYQDITARKSKEVLLKDQARKDSLTGIFNRRYFEEKVNEYIAKKTDDQHFAILMLDADFFKKVNDTYGHKIGDSVLISLATYCDKALRDSDIVARYGGEEFVMFLADTQEAQAVMVANRIREGISKIEVPTDKSGEFVSFTVSIGVCSSTYSNNLGDLVKKSDLALYKAKENGRNKVEVYTHSFDADAAKAEVKKESHHPIYDAEEAQEISLMDEGNIK